ncbi:hypothetical protein, partial [Leptospira santarosai]
MKQFLRNIEVKIESWDGKTKIFSYNPKEAIQFAIEFDVEFDKSNLTTISLYNVLNSTVEMCVPKTGKNKSDTVRSRAELSVGYGEDLSVIAKGEILQHIVKTSGPNRILEFKISDMVNTLFAFSVTMAFEKTLVSAALNQLFAKYGVSYFELRFSEDMLIEKISFSGESLDSVINQLAKRVKAHKYFKL